MIIDRGGFTITILLFSVYSYFAPLPSLAPLSFIDSFILICFDSFLFFFYVSSIGIYGAYIKHSFNSLFYTDSNLTKTLRFYFTPQTHFAVLML